MTTPSASPVDDGEGCREQVARGVQNNDSGRGVCFWYQATRMARASASCRYRMGNLAELLRGATTVSDRRPPLRAFDRARVVVVIRPFLDAAATAVLEGCRQRGARLVADFDDLLFAGDPAEYPLVLSGALDRCKCASRIAGYRTALAQFDAFTVSTEHLRQQLTAVVPGAKVAVVPNGVSPLWVRQGRALHSPWQPGDPKVIRFLPGSSSHDADFAAVVGMLADFLVDHHDVRLEIVGPLEFARDRLPVERVTQVPRVPFTELPRLLASSWVTLAPLLNTEFNRCKSAIKFLESAAFGAPCLSSPNPDMERHGDGGVLVAHNRRKWREVLERLLDDDWRMTLGRQGQRYVDRHGCATVAADVFTTWVGNGGGAWQRS